MRKLLLFLLLTFSAANAMCVEPLVPIPPIGCTFDDAVLVYEGDDCYYVFMNCGQ